MSATTQTKLVAAAKIGSVAGIAAALKAHFTSEGKSNVAGWTPTAGQIAYCDQQAKDFVSDIAGQDDPDVESQALVMAGDTSNAAQSASNLYQGAANGATEYEVVNPDPCEAICSEIVAGSPYSMDDDTGQGSHHKGCQCVTQPITPEGRSTMPRPGTNELRVTLTRAQVATEGGKSILNGVPIVFNQGTFIRDSGPGGGFGETIMPNALDGIIRDGSFAPVLIVGHDTSSVPLASVRAGTMSYDVRSDGLHIRAELDPASPHAQSVISAVNRGDLDGMSFVLGVDKGGDRWNADMSERVVDVISHCEEVTLTSFPAYTGTSTSMSDRAANSGDARIQRAQRDAEDALRSGKKLSASTVSVLQQAVTSHKAGTKAIVDLLKASGNFAPTAGNANTQPDGSTGQNTGGGIPGSLPNGDGSGSRTGLDILDADLRQLTASTAMLHALVIENIRREQGIIKPRHQVIDRRVRALIAQDLDELRHEQAIARIRQEAGL